MIAPPALFVYDADADIARKVGWADVPLYFPLSGAVSSTQPDTVEVLRGAVVRRFNRTLPQFK